MLALGQSFGKAFFIGIQVDKDIAIRLEPCIFLDVANDFVVKLVGCLGAAGRRSVEKGLFEIVAVAIDEDNHKFASGSGFELVGSLFVRALRDSFVLEIGFERGAYVAKFNAFVDKILNFSLAGLIKLRIVLEALPHVVMRWKSSHSGCCSDGGYFYLEKRTTWLRLSQMNTRCGDAVVMNTALSVTW